MKSKPHCFDPESFFPKSYRLDCNLSYINN